MIDTKTKTNTTTNASETVSKVSITVMGIISATIGIWAVACLVGAVVSNGPLNVIKGFASSLF